MEAGPMAIPNLDNLVQNITRSKEGHTIIRKLEKPDIAMMKSHDLITLKRWIEYELQQRVNK